MTSFSQVKVGGVYSFYLDDPSEYFEVESEYFDLLYLEVNNIDTLNRKFFGKTFDCEGNRIYAMSATDQCSNIEEIREFLGNEGGQYRLTFPGKNICRVSKGLDVKHLILNSRN